MSNPGKIVQTGVDEHLFISTATGIYADTSYPALVGNVAVDALPGTLRFPWPFTVVRAYITMDVNDAGAGGPLGITLRNHGESVSFTTGLSVAYDVVDGTVLDFTLTGDVGRSIICAIEGTNYTAGSAYMTMTTYIWIKQYGYTD